MIQLWQAILIQGVTFAGLIFVFRMLFYRQVNIALTRLKRLHEENLAREEELKKELEKARAQKEVELLAARSEADRIIKEAKGKAEKVNAESQLAAREQAERILANGKADLAKLENELALHYKEQAIELSVKMLKYTFTDQGHEALQHQLLAELIDEIKNLERDKFTVKTKQVQVLSPFSLSDSEKTKLSNILSDKIGVAAAIEEVIDLEVIAGLIVKIGALTIDGSLKNKLRKVIPYLKTEAPGKK